MPTNNTGPRPRRELVLRNRHARLPVDLALLRRITRAALDDPVFLTAPPPRRRARTCSGTRRRGVSSGPARLQFEVGCHLVDASEMAARNEQHLQHAGPTDVISFDYGARPGLPADAPWLCGELLVCLDVARTQAQQYQTTWPSELVRYVVHGLLHLRGYDDRTPQDRRTMKREEDRLLRRLGQRFAFRALGFRRDRTPSGSARRTPTPVGRRVSL